MVQVGLLVSVLSLLAVCELDELDAEALKVSALERPRLLQYRIGQRSEATKARVALQFRAAHQLPLPVPQRALLEHELARRRVPRELQSNDLHQHR